MSKPRNKKSRPQRQSEPSTQLDFWIALFVAIVTLAVFFPATRNEFVAWDDYELLVNNPRYRGLGWEQLRWMFSTFYMGHYQPLSWVTFGLDYLLWGMDPFGYHLTSVLLHTANAVLFFFVALRLLSLTIPPGLRDLALKAAAAVAALFFAVHPLRVESVAWVTERRDVLSGVFFLLTILGYLAAGDAPSRRRRRVLLVASLAAYVLAVGSKSIVMGLPLILIVLDVYPLRRLSLTVDGLRRGRAVLMEKVPFFFVGVSAAAVSYYVVKTHTYLTSFETFPWSGRVAMIFYTLWFYMSRTIVPAGLSPLYELPAHVSLAQPRFLFPALAVIATTITLIWLRRRWPAGLAAWV